MRTGQLHTNLKRTLDRVTVNSELFNSGQVKRGQVSSEQFNRGQRWERTGKQWKTEQVNSGQVNREYHNSGKIKSGQMKRGQINSEQVNTGQINIERGTMNGDNN